MLCMITNAATTSVPVKVLPFSSQVNVTKTGFSLTLLTASSAARASGIVIVVSITNRSTPACSSACACSVYTSSKFSKLKSPIGYKNLPVGAISPATIAFSPTASRDRPTKRVLYAAVWFRMPLPSSLMRLAPNVLAYTILLPAAT